MSSLTQTAYYTRRAINWTILGVIVYILLRIFWSLTVRVYQIAFPPKPPPPTNAFGRLPAIQFPKVSLTQDTQLTYKLETIQGTVPTASASALVFFMPKKPANLLALTQTQELAKRLNFDTTPIQESKNVYHFNDPRLPLRRFRYDLVTDNFTLAYDFRLDLGLFAENNLPPTEEAIVAQAKSWLQTYGLYNEDIKGGRTRVTYLKLDGSLLVATTSLSQADAARIEFFRKSVASTPVVIPYPEDAPIHVIFSGAEGQKRILDIKFTFWPIDYETTASYILKTSAQAWQELQSGAGFIARYPQKGTEAVVRHVYLAYYDSLDPQMYLQPVFVFEGDEGFLAYVPAVAPPWTE